jgi:hypothetical protein
MRYLRYKNDIKLKRMIISIAKGLAKLTKKILSVLAEKFCYSVETHPTQSP